MQGFLPVRSMLKDERGVTAIVVALALLLLIGFAALAIDVGHLCVARAELQNAADAGALAGARFLYNDDATVNTGANGIAIAAATGNQSEGVPVEVTGGDVQRGHWCFATSTFTQNEEATELPDFWGMTPDQIDNDTNFINAVRVVTRRQGTPVASFFATVFGIQSFQVSAEAIAYLGFTGDLDSGDVDQPIAICEESILDANGALSCNIGRMLNSGSNPNHNTGGWTNYSQDPCTTASASEMRDLVCSGNPPSLDHGVGMGATGGVQTDTLQALLDCWKQASNDTDDDGIPDQPIDSDGDGTPDLPWDLKLPVIECPGNNVSNCPTYTGVVNLKVVWITDQGEDPDYSEAPTKMGNWSNTNEDGKVRWESFVSKNEGFSLNNADGQTAPYEPFSVYFLPVCEFRKPAGDSNGDFYGNMAQRPKLVK